MGEREFIKFHNPSGKTEYFKPLGGFWTYLDSSAKVFLKKGILTEELEREYEDICKKREKYAESRIPEDHVEYMRLAESWIDRVLTSLGEIDEDD